MKKSLIAVAVAGLFAAPAAMAEVTLSGAINVGITVLKSGSSSTPGSSSVTSTSLANNYSHIDISSTDDIGNGNKVIFNYQMQANVGSLGDTPANRNSYLGFTGGWGTFKVGTNENVYEQYMYESDPLDGAVGLGGNIQMLGHSGLSGNKWFITGNTAGDQFWRRTDNTIWYDSPNMNGLTFGIAQTLSAHKTQADGSQTCKIDNTVVGGGPTCTLNADANPTITSLGVQYKPEGMPFFANLAYENHKDVANSLGGTNNKASAWQVGGGYTLSDLTLYARFESITYKATGGGADKAEVRHYWVAAKYNLPTGYVGAEIGLAPKIKVDGATQDKTKANMISAGYFHNLSKQSQLQFIATRISNDDNINYGIGAGAGSVDGDGRDYTGLTVGLKHTF